MRIPAVDILDTLMVYPRVCGGTSLMLAKLAMLNGLSPRVRGNHYGERRALSPTSVYPRVCGGTWCGANSDRTNEGLSPRVRGNP